MALSYHHTCLLNSVVDQFALVRIEDEDSFARWRRSTMFGSMCLQK